MVVTSRRSGLLQIIAPWPRSSASTSCLYMVQELVLMFVQVTPRTRTNRPASTTVHSLLSKRII